MRCINYGIYILYKFKKTFNAFGNVKQKIEENLKFRHNQQKYSFNNTVYYMVVFIIALSVLRFTASGYPLWNLQTFLVLGESNTVLVYERDVSGAQKITNQKPIMSNVCNCCAIFCILCSALLIMFLVFFPLFPLPVALFVLQNTASDCPLLQFNLFLLAVMVRGPLHILLTWCIVYKFVVLDIPVTFLARR